MGDLSWTPDARTILYVRGGGANRQGEYPNPQSDPDGVEQAIWAVAVDGGTPRKIAAGAAPAISPKGNRVAYVLRNQAWWVNLSDGAKPERFLEGRGQAGSLRWSPEGSKIAFASGRGDHAFVGVYSVAKNGLALIDPGVDENRSPEWSPDGTRVAFIRNPAFRNTFAFNPRRSGEPWSIRVADLRAATADGPGVPGREIFRAEAGRGSVFQRVNAENGVLWAGDRLVFPWERDGWLHLYSIPATGGAPTLTPARSKSRTWRSHQTARASSTAPTTKRGRRPISTAGISGACRSRAERRRRWRGAGMSGARARSATAGRSRFLHRMRSGRRIRECGSLPARSASWRRDRFRRRIRRISS